MTYTTQAWNTLHALTIITVTVVNTIAEMKVMSMINQIISFHKDLEKGQHVKIVTGLKDYKTYVNRTDVLKQDGEILQVFRANGAKIAINTNFIVMCCVVDVRL